MEIRSRMMPMELLSGNRLDLVVKYMYIANREKGYHLKFIDNLYREHIYIFSNGTCTEAGTPEKNSLDKYILAFDELIDSVKHNGLDEEISCVPISETGELVNGAHRTAIALYFDLSVPIVVDHGEVPCFDSMLMRKRLMKEESAEFIISEYVKLKQDVYIAVMWPKGDWKRAKNEVLDIFKQHGKIIYDKELTLNYNGIRNLLIQAYHDHDFVGNYKNHYKGINPDLYYEKDKKTTVFVFESGSLETVLNVKKNIRDILGIGNYSIHITDTHEEAVELANMLFHANTIDFMNNNSPDKYYNANRLIHSFVALIKENGLNIDDFVVGSSTVMALYGIRDSGDLDFLSVSENRNLVETNEIEDHEYLLRYYGGKSKEELIYNPQNYYRYMNVKFVIPALVREYKKNRGADKKAKKDKMDVKLLDQVISKKINWKRGLFKFQLLLYRIKNSIWNKMRKLAKRVLSKRAYGILKQLFYKLKRS